MFGFDFYNLSDLFHHFHQDLKKESEKKEEKGESAGFGDTKTAEVKPISNIAVKRKAEEDDSSSKKLAGEKETAAAS